MPAGGTVFSFAYATDTPTDVLQNRRQAHHLRQVLRKPTTANAFS